MSCVRIQFKKIGTHTLSCTNAHTNLSKKKEKVTKLISSTKYESALDIMFIAPLEHTFQKNKTTSSDPIKKRGGKQNTITQKPNKHEQHSLV